MKKLLFQHFWSRLAGALALSALALVAAGATAFGITVAPAMSDNDLPALLVSWTDASGQTRSAMMVTNGPSGPGYLRTYTYMANGAKRICTGTEKFGEFSGDGFVQNHSAAPNGQSAGGDFASTQLSAAQMAADTTTTVLQGASHVIIEFDFPDYFAIGPYYNPVNQYTVPTTIQWFFADGRNDPIFSISQDASQCGGNLGADSRSPYGDMVFDGGDGTSYVGGVAYGDTFKFVTLASDPEQVTQESGWDDTAPNTIPFAMKWMQSDGTTGTDAEFGHVATLPIYLSDQGQDSQYYNGNSTGSESYYEDVRGEAQPGGPMIDDQVWAYQVFRENPIWPAVGGINGSYRLTWGANWGKLGGFDGFGYGQSGQPDSDYTTYYQHWDDPTGNPPADGPNAYKGSGTTADGTLMAYSVFVVFGTHVNADYAAGTVGQESGGAVGGVVTQMENVTNAVFSTTSPASGTVVTSGPYGVGAAGQSQSFTYSPAGYNPYYSAWEISAAGNAVSATLTPAMGQPLVNPVILVDNYTSSQLPSNISVGPGLSKSGTDYFASLDTVGQRLWITVNSVVSSPLNLVVSQQAAPVINSIPLAGYYGLQIEIDGANFLNVSQVTIAGVSVDFVPNSSGTEIMATVPGGWHIGPVTVTTPGGLAVSATTIFTRQAIFRPFPFAQYTWDSISSSGAGGRIYISSASGQIYTSTDSGGTWTPVLAPTATWLALATSSDGNMVAAAADGGIWTTRSAGVSWAQSSAPTNLNWFAIASSTNGLKLTAIGATPIAHLNSRRGLAGPKKNLPTGNSVYSSSNYGGTWTESTLPLAQWSVVAMSGDGSKVAVAANPGGIYISSDSGATWTGTSAPSEEWTGLTMSVDGTKLSASMINGAGGQVYLSPDGGATWNPSGAPSLNWSSLSASFDGTHLVATGTPANSSTPQIYISADGGKTWGLSGLETDGLNLVVFSGDGKTLAGVGSQGALVAGPTSTPAPSTGVTYINTFPTGGKTQPFAGSESVASWIYWYGLGFNNIGMTNDTTMDAQGDPTSGSLMVHLPFGNAGDQGVFFGTFGNGAPYDESVTLDATFVTNLSFDIHFAPGTPVSSDGTLGAITMSLFPGTESGGDFNLFPSVTIPASATNGWFHVIVSVAKFLASEPLSGLTNCDAIGFNYNSYSGYPTQPVTFWIDNVAVNPAPAPSVPTVTWAAPAQIVYGTPLGVAQLNAQANVPGKLVYAPAPGAVLGAGAEQTLSVTFIPTNSAAYQTVTTTTTLTVTPAPLTVKANNSTRLSGQANPAFTATITGFVNGDTAAVVGGQASLGTKANSISAAGSYPIAAGLGTLSAANYVFTNFVSGTLTVTPAVVPPPQLAWGAVSLPPYDWQALAASTNGANLVVAAYGGQIYVSTNTGVSWVATLAPSNGWVSVASSADGSHLAAASSAGKSGEAVAGILPPTTFETGVICVSADGGASWKITSAPTNLSWTSIASSADGTKLAAVGITDALTLMAFCSSDSGATWISNTLPNLTPHDGAPADWGSIASSADGTRLVLAGNAGLIATSTNSGASWGTNTVPYALWTSVASSADGMDLAASDAQGDIWSSKDGGVTWTVTGNFPEAGAVLASSPNGMNLIASANSSFLSGLATGVYLSQDGGTDWYWNNIPGLYSIAVASSANGSELLATDGASVYMSPPPPAKVTPTLIWLAPAPLVYGTPLSSMQLNATASVPGTFVYSPPAGTVLGAGLAQILEVTFMPTDTNHYSTGSLNLSVYVEPAPLTVTANNASREAGQANPAFTGTISGLVNGDTASVVTGQASLTTTASSTSVAGSYPIMVGQGTLSATNYTFANFVNGTLTVTPAVAPPPLLTWGAVSLPAYSWQAVAASTNGVDLVAAAYSGQIYVSTNTGVTWSPTPAPSQTWVSVASSADGSHLAAVSAPQNFDATMNSNGFNLTGVIAVSANGGASWTVTGAPTNMAWVSIASSGDGTKLAALGVTDAPLLMAFNSSDSGATWTSNTLPFLGHYGASPSTWGSIASSADGSRLVAAGQPGWIFTSSNGGMTWNSNTAPDALWTSVASSADGTQLVAANEAGGVWTSKDGGVTWTQNSTPALTWTGLASAPDGSKLIAVANSMFAPKVQPGVYLSPDGGADWFSNNVPGLDLIAVASAANGAEVLAVDGSGVIFMSPPPPPTPPAYSWTSNSVPMVQWAAVASDASGTNLAAVGMSVGGLFPVVYHSANEGSSWIQGSPFPTVPSNEGTSYFLNSAASSADGSKLVAGGSGGWVYLSTDSGNSWHASGAPTNFYTSGGPTAVASSADGTHLVAAGGGSFGAVGYGISSEPVYLSANSGASWAAQPAASGAWTSVAMSTNGSTIAVVGSDPVSGLGIYAITMNGGSTWSSNALPAGEVWLSIASSADGSKLAAGSLSGLIYISTNSGVTWLATPAPKNEWNSIASSADGSRLVAASGSGELLVSTNGGAGWLLTGAPAADWLSVAISADGSKMVAASAYQLIYTLEIAPVVVTPPQPVSLAVSYSPTSGITITWPSSAAGFVLQQTPNLASKIWTPVNQTPADNGVTKQVVITPGAGMAFFRLAQ